MQRRNLLIGMGSLTVGGAAAVGTGAFTSVTAERTVKVNVVGDQNAFLGIQQTGSANSQDYVDIASSGEVELILDDSDNGGSGFNPGAETEIDNLLKIVNQGTQTIYFWVNFEDPDNDKDTPQFDDENIWFYPNGDTTDKLNDNDGEVLGLTPGESATLGLKADTTSLTKDAGSEDPVAVFHAESEKPGESSSVDDSGGDFAVVANDGSGDYSDLQTAIDDVEGSTVVVKDTGTPYTVSDPKLELDKQGLELRGLGGKPTIKYEGGYPSRSDFPGAENEPAIMISSADVTLENLRFEMYGAPNGEDELKPEGGDPLVRITELGTEMTNVDLAIESNKPKPFGGNIPGLLAFNVPAIKGAGNVIFDDILVENNAKDEPHGNQWLSTAGLFRDTSSTSDETNVARTATIRNSEFRSGITVDAHPGDNQSIEITDNSFYGGSNGAGTPEGVQPSPSGGAVTIENNAFEYLLNVDDEGDSDKKIKFAGLPKTINGSNVGDVSMAQMVGEDNEQADGSGGYENAAVLIVGVEGGPYTNSTYESYSS
jgi:hypothetical protein